MIDTDCNVLSLEEDMNESVSHLNERDPKDMKVRLKKN